MSAGASVPQQQTIRDFTKSRAKALKDIANSELVYMFEVARAAVERDEQSP